MGHLYESFILKTIQQHQTHAHHIYYFEKTLILTNVLFDQQIFDKLI